MQDRPFAAQISSGFNVSDPNLGSNVASSFLQTSGAESEMDEMVSNTGVDIGDEAAVDDGVPTCISAAARESNFSAYDQFCSSTKIGSWQNGEE